MLRPSFQTTLKRPIKIEGIGLHTDLPVTIELSPAPCQTGVIFRSRGVSIPASLEYVADTRRCVILASNGTCVQTAEHLLSALRGMGVDNVFVDIEGEELPALDGSSAPYVQLIEKTGIISQKDACRRVVKYDRKEAFDFQDGISRYAILPAKSLTLKVTISFPGTLIGVQEIEFEGNGSYGRDISRARTFCLESEFQALRDAGLAKGGSLENAVVVGSKSILNKEPLRYQDEFVRHKALDLLGDISLLGPGEYQFACWAFAPSHRSNIRLISELKKQLVYEERG